MPKTKRTPVRKTPPPSLNGPSSDVLTLPEAAAYLRVNADELLRALRAGNLPGREIGGQWRLSQSALQVWLRSPRKKNSVDAMLALAGTGKDDPDLERIVEEAYQRRGRPMLEEKE